MSDFAEGMTRLEQFLARSTESVGAAELDAIAIVFYDGRYRSDFKRLNEAWISEHFEMEEIDHKVLNHPQQYIIDTGGEILFAVDGVTVAGTCALVRMENSRFDFELTKMAVDPVFRG